MSSAFVTLIDPWMREMKRDTYNNAMTAIAQLVELLLLLEEAWCVKKWEVRNKVGVDCSVN